MARPVRERYFTRGTGPLLRAGYGPVTYALGTFTFDVGSDSIQRSFYAPFALNDDKCVSMGAPAPIPGKLVIRNGFM